MKSVTKILGRVFPMNPNIPKHVLENARVRGTSVHEWIEKFNNYKQNGGEYPVINLEYQIYADYYEEWFNENEVEPIMSEMKLSHDDVVGVIDMLCKTKDFNQVLVSFKITYGYDIAYCELQESAYNELLFKNGLIEAKVPQMLLHINKNGYSYIRLEDQWEMFKKIKEIDEYISSRNKK